MINLPCGNKRANNLAYPSIVGGILVCVGASIALSGTRSQVLPLAVCGWVSAILIGIAFGLMPGRFGVPRGIVFAVKLLVFTVSLAFVISTAYTVVGTSTLGQFSLDVLHGVAPKWLVELAQMWSSPFCTLFEWVLGASPSRFMGSAVVTVMFLLCFALTVLGFAYRSQAGAAILVLVSAGMVLATWRTTAWLVIGALVWTAGAILLCSTRRAWDSAEKVASLIAFIASACLLLMAIVLAISPIDVIPDIVVLIGFIDDVALLVASGLLFRRCAKRAFADWQMDGVQRAAPKRNRSPKLSGAMRHASTEQDSVTRTVDLRSPPSRLPPQRDPAE